MTKKKRIHPSITITADNIITKIGKKHSQAFEEYACLKATNKEIVMIEEGMLKDRERELLEDRQKIDERLEKVRDELAKIKQIKQDFNPVKTTEFEETVAIVRQMLESVPAQIRAGKWGVQKISLDDIGKVCRQSDMPIQAVLNAIPKSLLKYIDEYVG